MDPENSHLKHPVEPMKTTAKTRVLFVDDEPMMLDLLRMTVEMMSGEWETRFAESGHRALSLMEKEQFDLVVSDMRMPGMTGVQLLNEVMRRHPATSRIILSGYADREDLLRCVGVTHQFLAKPCELPAIQATLKRIQGLRERLRSPEIQKLVAERQTLPSIPAVFFRIVEALQQPDCPLESISQVVASDAALTAKLLQVVNSAFFGFAREVSSAHEAVLLLGVGTIRCLALTLHLFSAFKGPGSDVLSAERIWRHSMQVGQWAKRIAELEGGDGHLVEQCFTAGILHDVGKLILAETLSDKYLDLIARAESGGRLLADLEQEELGATHADVAAYLIDLWGLPGALVEAVALHHDPARAVELTFGPLAALHTANVFANAAEKTHSSRAQEELNGLYLDQLGLSNRPAYWRGQLLS
jgi:HD-like signal output (HDOD) protein